MDAELKLGQLSNLKLHKPEPANLNFGASSQIAPNSWFVQRYQDQFHQFGSPFLELTQSNEFGEQIILVSINTDFFASILGGRKDLNHHTIYYETEMAWYFKDWDSIYKPTTAEKLQNLYRALLMKCAQDMPPNIHVLNLFHEFRSDKVAKAVVQRAKSVLAAEESFFSATSPNQRIRGTELVERIARVFVDSLLTKEPGQILKLQDAYISFLALLKEKDLPQIKRSDFKAVVGPLIREQFDVALRNDLNLDERSGIRGWKGVKLLQASPT